MSREGRAQALAAGSARAFLRLAPERLRAAWLSAALLLGAGPARLSSDDWPQWLGPLHNGTSLEQGWLKTWPLDGPPRLWEKRIGHGYSGITTSRNRLFLFHRTGDTLHLDALETLTGRRVWRFSYPTDYEDAYGYDNGPRCAPAVVGTRVFILGPKGILHAVDFEDGKRIWRRDLKGEFGIPPNFFGTGATPLVAGDVVYAHVGGTDLGTGMAFALDAATGRIRWRAKTDGGSYASPVLGQIAGTGHLFIFHRGGLSDFDPETGKERWKFPWRSRNYYSVNAATPLVAGDLVFFSSTYGMGAVCLRVVKDACEVVWKDDLKGRHRILDIHWAPPNYAGGHVYGFSGRHEAGSSLRCVELATGRLRWSWPAEESGLGRGSMIYSDGHFIALGERGDLVLLKLTPEGHRELARVRRILSYPAWTVPTLSGGILYLRDLERLIALDLRVPGDTAPDPSGPERERRTDSARPR